MKTLNTACIIDDDAIFRFGTKKMMEVTDFCQNILIYKNGKEAYDDLLPKLRNNQDVPDVILLDLNMPIMDGWQLLDELIKIPNSKKVPIYIVSSSVDHRDFEKAKSYEVVSNYIVKPFSISKITALLQELLNS